MEPGNKKDRRPTVLVAMRIMKRVYCTNNLSKTLRTFTSDSVRIHFFSRAINDLRSQFPCSFSHIRFSCIITVIMCEVQDARHSLSAWQATTCNTHHHCSWNLSLTVPVPVNVVRFTLRLWLLAVLLCYFCVYFVFLFRIILAYMYMCVCVHFSVLLSVKCSHFGIFSPFLISFFTIKSIRSLPSRYGHFLVLTHTLFAIRNWSSHGVRESASRSMLHINIDFLVIMFSDRSIYSHTKCSVCIHLDKFHAEPIRLSLQSR